MDEPGNLVDPSTISKLTLLEQVKLQAQVVVPLLRAFRKELGTERANAIAYRALDKWSRGLFHQLSQSMGKGSRETWTAIVRAADRQRRRLSDAPARFRSDGVQYHGMPLRRFLPRLGGA